MTDLMFYLIGGIGIVTVLLGLVSIRDTKGTERGSEPGKGDHVIHVNYNSGGGGGTQQSSYTIPKDPQAYAKRFIPKDAPK